MHLGTNLSLTIDGTLGFTTTQSPTPQSAPKDKTPHPHNSRPPVLDFVHNFGLDHLVPTINDQATAPEVDERGVIIIALLISFWLCLRLCSGSASAAALMDGGPGSFQRMAKGELWEYHSSHS